MPDEVRADPVELGRAAELTLAESQELFDALTVARHGLPFGAAATGGTSTAKAVAGRTDGRSRPPVPQSSG